MSKPAAAGVEPANAPPSPSQPVPPPPHLPPHLDAYLSSPAVTAFLSSLAPHFPSYTADALSSLFATLLAARYRHSPLCTSQLQWTHKYAPTSINELWSHGPQTATLQHYTHSLAAATATASSFIPSLLLVGPSSSSKTAAAYAIAATLQSAVIEVHPGMARSGRDVQALCGEATQSHRLHGDRKDVWAVVKEERWRSWEKSKNKQEEQRESDEPDRHDLNEQHKLPTKRAQRGQRGKQATTKSNAKPQSRRRRKQRQSESEQSELEAHSDAELPERLVIRLKLRSNNRARLLSCPVVPLSPPQQQSAGKHKAHTSEQRGGTIASFFTHQAAGQPTGQADEQQAEDEDDVVIERTEGVVVDSGSSVSKKKDGKGNKAKQKLRAIGDFFHTAPASSSSEQRQSEETKEEPQLQHSTAQEPDKEAVPVERNARTSGGGGKKRKKSKRRAVEIGSFFSATADRIEEDDVVEETKEAKEEPTAATRQSSDARLETKEDTVMEEQQQAAVDEEVKGEQTALEQLKEEDQEKEDREDSKRKVQKGIGSFFGGKSEIVVLADTTIGKRRGRKGKRAATPIDLTSPPPSARNSSPTPPSPPQPPSPPPTTSSSAPTAQPSSSVILFEDVDLVFPTDVNFHRTLKSLVLTAKRPLLLTAQCVPSWVDEVSDDKLRIVQMARMGDEECVLHALLICAVETGVDAGDEGGKGWTCMDVARLCHWWRYDVRRVLMTLQVLVGARDTHAFSSEAVVDVALLPPAAATSLLSSPPTVSSPSSLLLSVVGLSSVSHSVLSTFSTMTPSFFALLCSTSSAVDVTHLNWLSTLQRRALAVMQRLPLIEVYVTAGVEEMISLEDVSEECVSVVIEDHEMHDSSKAVVDKVEELEVEQAVQASASVERAAETRQEQRPEVTDSSAAVSLADDEAEVGSSRRVEHKRKVIAEDDEEYVHDEPMHSDPDRLDSDVILVESPSPLSDPTQQQASFILQVRRLACQQLQEREREHRLAYAASSSPSLAQTMACRLLDSIVSLSSLLADCNILSCVRLLPLSSTVPSSLFYRRHASLPPQFIDVNVPYSGSSYRCAEWWLTGERDGLRGEMDEERRDEQPMCEEMFEELRADIETMGLSGVRRAVEQLEVAVEGRSAAELNQRQEATVPPPRRNPLGRQHGPIDVIVPADMMPASFVPTSRAVLDSQPSDPVAAVHTASDNIAVLPATEQSADSLFELQLAPSRLPTMASAAARLSTIDASRALFSSLRCKLHAPSSRTWLTDIYPFLCQMGTVEGQREDERRIEEQKAREERHRVAEERRARRQEKSEARQLKRRERKRARKEKRKRKRAERLLTSTTSSSSNSSSDDSSSSHTEANSDEAELDEEADSDGSECGGERVMDFFAPRSSARRSRRRHLSSRRVAADGVSREELHVCGGLNEALYQEVMGALRLPRWRDWTDE